MSETTERLKCSRVIRLRNLAQKSWIDEGVAAVHRELKGLANQIIQSHLVDSGVRDKDNLHTHTTVRPDGYCEFKVSYWDIPLLIVILADINVVRQALPGTELIRVKYCDI